MARQLDGDPAEVHLQLEISFVSPLFPSENKRDLERYEVREYRFPDSFSQKLMRQVDDDNHLKSKR